MQDKLRTLITKHCTWLADTVDNIGDAIERLEKQPELRRQALEQALHLTHQISGSSGSVGFNDVSVAAKALERQLGDMATDDNSRAAATLFDRLKSVAGEVSPERSTLFDFKMN